MMIKRSPNLSAMRRKSYEAVLRFQIYKVKRECRGGSRRVQGWGRLAAL